MPWSRSSGPRPSSRIDARLALSAQRQATTSTLRTFVLLLFLFGVVGTGTELYLLEHTEDVWQWLPLALIALSLVVLLWRSFDRGPVNLRCFQAAMVLFVIGGTIGLIQHYRGNAEFELEMYPSITGFELFSKAITGATPALAPGALIQLGLLGLAFTYRHPALSSAPTND